MNLDRRRMKKVSLDLATDSRMLLTLLIISLFFGALHLTGISPKAEFCQELSKKALDAFRDKNLSESKRLYEQLWNDKATSLEDFTRAGRMLAYFEHHFSGNMDGVYPYFDEIIKRNPDKLALYLELADYDVRSHRYPHAKETLKRASKEDPPPEQVKKIGILWSKVILEELIRGPISQVDHEQLKGELSKIEGFVNENPEDTELAYLQMGFSLLSKKIDLFWQGWHNYFRIPRDKEARSFLAKSQNYLASGLETWERGGVSPDLIIGLVFSRLYDFAMMMVKLDASGLNKQPDVQKLSCYCQYIDNTWENGLSYYRNKAFGNNDCDSFFAEQDKLDLWMWEKLKAEKDNYSRENLEAALYDLFGLKMMFTGRGESQDLIIFGGHGYIEETVQIEQYGRTGSFKYIKLHNYVGNIYDHWYQNFMGIGGWASTDGEVMQVRNWYITYPVSVWTRLNDKETRERWQANIISQMEKDANFLKKDPYAFPLGFASHIKFLRYDQMINSLKQKGLNGPALKMAFLSEVEYFFEYTGMHLHEARHVLDNPIYLADKENYPLEVREFRAKLSEIAFSPDPHLVVAESILEEGTANRKVIEVIVNWMQENKGSVKNFDPTIPVLLQLMNVTEQQLKEAVRSADPFYQTSKIIGRAVNQQTQEKSK